MRIAFLSTGHPTEDCYPEGGGIQYEIQGLAQELAHRGHEAHILTRRVGPDAPSRIEFHEVQVPGNDEVLSVIKFGRRALEHIRRIDPDILYLSERFSAAWAVRFPGPKVFTFHNSDGVRPYWRFAVGNHPANVILFPFKNMIEEHVMRSCHQVIIPGRSWTPYLESRGVGNGTVIPHGLHVADFGDHGDKGFLLFAGRLSRVKGIDVLLRAYAHLNPHNRLPLYLAGSGPEEAELRRLAVKLGVVGDAHFLGKIPREELHALYASCSALVLPSRWETFGLVAAEGMASGKAVIASDIPGPRDYIRSGENGLLVPPGDIGALARALTVVLEHEDLRRRLGAAAMRHARSEFPFSRVAGEHEKLHTQLLEHAEAMI